MSWYAVTGTLPVLSMCVGKSVRPNEKVILRLVLHIIGVRIEEYHKFVRVNEEGRCKE